MFRMAGKLVVAVAAATVLLSASGASARMTAPVEGLWRTADGDGLVEISLCGQELCGYVVDDDPPRPGETFTLTPGGRPHGPMADPPLLAKFVGGPKTWTGGRIYNPENGKVYSGVLQLLDTARLKVTGCLVRPLCGSQIWVRAK